MMRLLTGFYVLLGSVHVVLASAIAFLNAGDALRKRPSGYPKRDPYQTDEGYIVAALVLFVGLLPLAAAFGLWKRWPIVRYVLLGLSWWSVGVSVLVIGFALGALVGIFDPHAFGHDSSPLIELATAAGLAAYAIVQYWVLTRSAVRDSFQRTTSKPKMVERRQ
jgi:hypothetical protein